MMLQSSRQISLLVLSLILDMALQCASNPLECALRIKMFLLMIIYLIYINVCRIFSEEHENNDDAPTRSNSEISPRTNVNKAENKHKR